MLHPRVLNQQSEVTAYTVFTRLRTRNQAELDHYAKQAASFLAGHEITWLAPFGRPFEVVRAGGRGGRPPRVPDARRRASLVYEPRISKGERASLKRR